MKQYQYKVNGTAYDVTIRSIVGDKASVEVNGIPFEVEMQGTQLVDGNLPDAAPAAEPAASAAPAPAPAAAPAESSAAAAGEAGEGKPVTAPLPGVVTKLCVNKGDTVKKGQTVLVLEAMKMENNIAAENDGTITGICVKAGDSVLEGTVLLTIG